MSCESQCLLCTTPQHYKVNFSKYHGICQAHKSSSLQNPLTCRWCDSTVQILKYSLAVPVCEFCLVNPGNYISDCPHRLCEDCVLVEKCNICSIKSIDSPSQGQILSAGPRKRSRGKSQTPVLQNTSISKSQGLGANEVGSSIDKQDHDTRHNRKKSTCGMCLEFAEQRRGKIAGKFECSRCRKRNCPLCRMMELVVTIENSPREEAKGSHGDVFLEEQNEKIQGEVVEKPRVDEEVKRTSMSTYMSNSTGLNRTSTSGSKGVSDSSCVKDSGSILQDHDDSGKEKENEGELSILEERTEKDYDAGTNGPLGSEVSRSYSIPHSLSGGKPIQKSSLKQSSDTNCRNCIIL